MNSRNHTWGDAPMAMFLKWWHLISSETAGGGARADRAALRHASSLLAVACTPAYQRIYRDLAGAHDGARWQPFQQDRIAALIGLAAHVQSRTELSLPKAMSQRAPDADRNPVSELRFRRLLEAPDIESLYTGIRRCLPLIEHRLNVASLADDVLHWGDAVKKRWAYDYQWPDKSAS